MLPQSIKRPINFNSPIKLIFNDSLSILQKICPEAGHGEDRKNKFISIFNIKAFRFINWTEDSILLYKYLESLSSLRETGRASSSNYYSTNFQFSYCFRIDYDEIITTCNIN